MATAPADFGNLHNGDPRMGILSRFFRPSRPTQRLARVLKPEHSGFFMSVAGEQYHQDHLRRISPGKLNDQRRYDTARLIREPANEHDANAVRIDVKGSPIGYLPSHNAETLAPSLDALAQKGIAVECRVTYTGGSAGRNSIGATLGLSNQAVGEINRHAGLRS